MKKLTQKRVDWIISKIVEWYRIREDNGYDTDPTMPDVDHSSLLRMLLGGEKIYKYPPPRAYSYPNYHAVENETIPMEVWFPKDKGWPPDAENSVMIEQAAWTILREEGENYIIQWEGDPAEWVLRPRTQEEFDQHRMERHFTSTLSDEEYDTWIREHFKKYHKWALKRTAK